MKKKYKLKEGVAEKVIRGKSATGEDAEDLARDEFFGDSDKSTLDLSETDESENEGLGDGKMGRATRNPEE